jgi:hypothetical protein
MNRTGPVLAWCAAAVFVDLVCGDAVLRSSFSEERANLGENQHWCGAASEDLTMREAKCGFLFQICTTHKSRAGLARGIFIRLKSLIGLSLWVLGRALQRVSHGCNALCMMVVDGCPGCAGFDSELFYTLRTVPYESAGSSRR